MKRTIRGIIECARNCTFYLLFLLSIRYFQFQHDIGFVLLWVSYLLFPITLILPLGLAAAAASFSHFHFHAFNFVFALPLACNFVHIINLIKK